MKTTITEDGRRLEVTIEGDLYAAASQEKSKAFQPLMDAKDQVIFLDCKGLNYILSNDLRLFLGLLKRYKPNGDTLVLEHLNDNIRKVLTMTGISTLFDTCCARPLR